MTYVSKHVETTESGPVFMMVYLSGAFHNSELMEAAVFLMLLKEVYVFCEKYERIPHNKSGGSNHKEKQC